MPRILLIDDDDQVRMMMRMTLEKEGYVVEEAPDGSVGIRLYREQPADLVITDIVMPEKEGMETIMTLKRDFPSVKIIAISGGGKIAPARYLDLAEQMGVQRTFSKPLDRSELLMAIREVLDAQT
jgi:CheY-like chemotaxis protein